MKTHVLANVATPQNRSKDLANRAFHCMPISWFIHGGETTCRRDIRVRRFTDRFGSLEITGPTIREILVAAIKLGQLD